MASETFGKQPLIYSLSKLSWRGKNNITYERKQLRKCGLHHWIERAKAVVAPTAHVCRLFLTIYTKLVYLSYPSILGDFGLFEDVLRILSVRYLSAY